MNEQIWSIVGDGREWLAAALADWLALVEAAAPVATPRALALLGFVIGVGAVVDGCVRYAVRSRGRQNLGGVSVTDFVRDVKFFTPVTVGRSSIVARRSARSDSPSHDATFARAARVETRVMNVHPSQEQNTIDLMQRFKWGLKSSQLIKTKDTHLERRGDETWSVTETEEFVHLVFERDLDDPNINKIQALEAEFLSIRLPQMPSYFGPVVTIIVGLLLLGALVGIPIIAGGIYWWSSVAKRKPQVAAEVSRLLQRKVAILDEVDRL